MDERFAGLAPDAARLSPSPVYLDGADAIRVTAFGNAAGVVLGIAARILKPDNTINVTNTTLVPLSNRTAASNVVRVSEGWLLGLEIRVISGTPAGNAVWCSVDIVRDNGAAPLGVQGLAADFVSSGTPLIFPGSANVDPLDGAGCLRSISGTTPGVGAEISETVPTNARWKFISLRATLVVSAAVASRNPTLLIDDGVNPSLVVPVSTLTASQSAVISWMAGFGAKDAGVTTAAWCASFPAEPFLGAGFRLRTVTGSIQAGDAWSAPQYLVREWLDV